MTENFEPMLSRDVTKSKGIYDFISRERLEREKLKFREEKMKNDFDQEFLNFEDVQS